MCVFFFFCPECRAWGRSRKFSKLVVIQSVEDESLCWQDPAQQSHISISLVGFQLTLGLGALVLFQSYLICMYALFISLFSALTIENKLTFLGFIFVFSKPVEKTWRRTQEVRPHSQAVNPPRWPYRPFLFSPFHSSPPLLSLSHPFSPSWLRNSQTPPVSHSLSLDASPAWVRQTQALSKETRIHSAGCCTQPCIAC